MRTDLKFAHLGVENVETGDPWSILESNIWVSDIEMVQKYRPLELVKFIAQGNPSSPKIPRQKQTAFGSDWADRGIRRKLDRNVENVGS